MLPIYMIAACSKNFVISRQGQLPWHQATDLSYFKKITENHPIIMGRATWDSLGHKILPKRVNIVVSNQQEKKITIEQQGAYYASSLEEAYDLANNAGKQIGAEAIFVIGGAMLYRSALKHVEKIFLTKILTELEGDRFFPKFSENEFCLISSHYIKASLRDDYDMEMKIFAKRK